MRPAYYVIDTTTNTPIPAVIRPAAWRDLQKTENEHWQTSWLSKFIQHPGFWSYSLQPHRPVHAFDRWRCRKKSVLAVFRGVNNVGREIS